MAKREKTRDEARVVRALEQMPYGGLRSVAVPAEKIGQAIDTGEPLAPVVADYLEALAVVLRTTSASAVAQADRLAEYEADMAALGRLISRAVAREGK